MKIIGPNSGLGQYMHDQSIVSKDVDEIVDETDFMANWAADLENNLSEVQKANLQTTRQGLEQNKERMETLSSITKPYGDELRGLGANPFGGLLLNAAADFRGTAHKLKNTTQFFANTSIDAIENLLIMREELMDAAAQGLINTSFQIPGVSETYKLDTGDAEEQLAEKKRIAESGGDPYADQRLPRIGEQGEIEKMLEPMASFFLTMFAGGAPLKGSSWTMKGIVGGFEAAWTMDLEDGNLGYALKDMLGEGGFKDLAEYLSSKPENAEIGYERLQLRVKNLVEEGGLNAIFMGLPPALRAMKAMGVKFLLGGGATVATTQEAEANILTPIIKGGGKVLDSLGFFSEAVEQTKNLNIEKGSGTQFLSLLKKGGVKDEELKWTGLDDLLNNKKVTKQEILDQLENEAVTLEEIPKTVQREDAEMTFFKSHTGVNDDNRILYGEEGTLEERLKNNQLKNTLTPEEAYGEGYIDERAEELFEEWSEGGKYPVDKTYTPKMKENAYNEALKEYYDNPIRIYEDENTGMVITGNDELGYSIFNNRAESSDWKNRVNPHQESVDDLDEAKIQAQQLAEEDGRLAFGEDVVQHSEYTVSGGDNYREFLLTLPYQKGRGFTAGHYSEENVVAHFRTTDIKGPNGEKALFIEEIQSDWAQKGRRRGFQPSEEEFKVAKENAEKLADDYRKILNTYTILHEGKQVPFVDFYDQKLGDEMLGIQPTQMVEGSPLTLDPSQLNNRLIDQMRNGVVYNKNGELVDSTAAATDVLADVFEAGKRYNAEWRKLGPTIPKAPFVTDPKYQRNWTALSIKRILAKAVEEGYEYVSFATGESGKAQNYFARSNDNIKKYYGETIPSVLNNIVKKYDSEALVREGNYEERLKEISFAVDYDTGVFTNSLKVKLTDKLKNAIKEGQALFAIPAAVTGAGVAMNNTNEMRN